MKNYIIFDLEWNQSPRGREDSVADFPFEIIEIGAVKLDENFQMVDEFHRLIRPQVYGQMHHMISEVTHMNMEELKARGLNDSITHVDFMVGTPDLNILGITHDGKEIPVFVDGNFAPEI